MTTYRATRISPFSIDVVVAEGGLEDVLSAAIRNGAGYDDNKIEALEQRGKSATLKYGNDHETCVVEELQPEPDGDYCGTDADDTGERENDYWAERVGNNH